MKTEDYLASFESFVGSENVLTNKFEHCLVNYEESLLLNSFSISSQKWLVDERARSMFESLSNQLRKFL